MMQGWTNGPDQMTCDNYAGLWCENGDARPGQEWALDRPQYRQPRLNCCVCGKKGCATDPKSLAYMHALVHAVQPRAGPAHGHSSREMPTTNPAQVPTKKATAGTTQDVGELCCDTQVLQLLDAPMPIGAFAR